MKHFNKAQSDALNDVHEFCYIIRALANHFIVLASVDEELRPKDSEVFHLIFMMNHEAQAMARVADLPGGPFNENFWDAVYSVMAITCTMVATWRDNGLENQLSDDTTATLMLAVCRATDMVDQQMELHRARWREAEPAAETTSGPMPAAPRTTKQRQRRTAEVTA